MPTATRTSFRSLLLLLVFGLVAVATLGTTEAKALSVSISSTKVTPNSPILRGGLITDTVVVYVRVSVRAMKGHTCFGLTRTKVKKQDCSRIRFMNAELQNSRHWTYGIKPKLLRALRHVSRRIVVRATAFDGDNVQATIVKKKVPLNL